MATEVLRDDRELLADLRRASTHSAQFALEFMSGELSVDAEEAYAYLLEDIADRLLLHAKGRKGLVLDGEPTPLVIDVQGVVVDNDGHGQ
jgi:hypothetical protein